MQHVQGEAGCNGADKDGNEFLGGKSLRQRVACERFKFFSLLFLCWAGRCMYTLLHVLPWIVVAFGRLRVTPFCKRYKCSD